MFCNWFKGKTQTVPTPSAPILMPEDFVDDYFHDLDIRGLKLLRPVLVWEVTDEYICGESVANYYNGCEIPNTPRLQVDKSLYMAATNIGRKILVRHELSHKILKLPHRPGPAIMQERTLDDNYYIANEKELMDQLVADGRKQLGLPGI